MLRAGLIGLPAAGKTTLFLLLTGAHGVAPPRHGKGEAHVGVTRVPDARVDRLAALFARRKRVPATVEFADIAAAGRQSTAALLDTAAFRDADALVHVVRAFRDSLVPHVRGSIDPRRDAQAMDDELVLADLAVVERRLDRIERDLKKAPSKDLEEEQATLARCRSALEQGTPLRATAMVAADLKRLRGFQLLTAKPLLIAVNLDEADAAHVGHAGELTGLGPFAARTATRLVAVCAKIELEIAQLDSTDAAAFLADLGLSGSGLDRVIQATYDLLGYVSFFTVGDEECRAWSVPRGTVAHAAAAEIHTDMARGFIRAEVVSYECLITRGSLAACRDHGELKLEGKDYVVRDGDVITFRFAT